MTASALVPDLEFSFFKRKIFSLTGIDLNCYKGEQMRRRLNTLLSRTQTRNLSELAALLARDPAQLKAFLDFFTINVSEFFRDPDKFEQLRSRILPELLRERRQLHIWSAGCSHGAEPYSLAILLEELSPLARHRILATDIDAATLRSARAGNSYTQADVRNVRENWLQAHFTRHGDAYAVVDRIKKKVDFREHNLLADPFEADFDLILCRNVTIYFTEAAKQRLNANFVRSLRTGGMLFIGGTEILPQAAELGLQHVFTSFYRKVGNRER